MKNKIFAILALATSMVFTACLKEDINPATGTPSPYASIEVLRSAYKGTDVALTPEKLMGAYKIAGVVISDAASKNVKPGILVIQNTFRGNTRGITVSVAEAATLPFAMGDSIVIDVNGASLKNVNGTLQLTGVTLSGITKAASNISVKPKQVKLSELATDFDKFEGTLVEVNADIKPTPVAGETYGGDKKLYDGTNADVYLHTEATAAFAERRVPASAAFTGIAVLYNDKANTKDGAVQQIWMRNISDVKNASGPLYAKFPEDFESPDATAKSSYNMTTINNNIELKTGNWKLYQAILGNTGGRDRFNPAGKQCIRMQQELSESGYVQMNFDLPYGASKVTLSYGSYYTDASSTWRLEYSIDGGTTWQQTGSDIKDASATPKTATFLMDIQVPVRFRINKLGLGKNNGTTIFNGRLSIEDIAIYQN